MRSLICSVAVVALLSSCGGSSGDGDDTAPSATTSPPPSEPSPTASSNTEPAVTDAPPPAEPPTTDAPAPTLPEPVPWASATFDEAIEPTMEALAVGVGQPFSPEAVAPEIVLPPGLPSLGGPIVGAGWASEIDAFDGGFEIVYHVGLDQPVTAEELEAWQVGVGESDPAWRAPSFAESGSLYTSLLVNEATDERLVHVLDVDAPANGRPPLNLQWSPLADALRVPDWVGSLPVPEGGELTEVSVARGDVAGVLGGRGFDGNVFLRIDFASEDYDRMVEYFESGILLGAGFTYEPSPISNTRYRRDVAIGDWSGEVAIGRATVDDEEFLQVIWSLTRGA